VRAYADSYDYRMYSTSSAAEDCSTDSPAGCRTTIRGASKWGGTELVATFDWTRDGKWTSLVGTDVRLERIEASTTSADLATGTRTGTPGASTELNKRFAAFGEQRARPIRWLYFTAGLRGDIAEGYPGALSPRASVAVEPWQAGTLKAVYAEAFRAPSSYERRYQDVTQIMADRLEPERVRTVQASFEQRLGGHRVLFGVFQSWWTDLVDVHPLTSAELEAVRARGLVAPGQDSVSQYQNVDSVRNHGWETAVEGTLAARRLRYGLNVTGAYSRRMTEGQETPLAVAPSLFGNARVAYDLGGALPTLALAGQLAARRPADLAFDSAFKPVPYAPARVELRAAITGAFPHVPGLSYRVTGQKAFATREAYVIGPNQSGATGGAAELAPIDNELRVGLGLTYNLGW
jgi:outer membrane receptor protein involved in Fe transport